MMRRFSEIVAGAFVLGSFFLYFPVKAEKFYRTPELESKIAVSVGKSGIVKGKSAKERSKKKGRRGAGDKVCENRLQLLYAILSNKDLTDCKVSGIVGVYLREAHLNPNTFEGRQLHKSHTVEDLFHNVEVLISIYEDLRGNIVV